MSDAHDSDHAHEGPIKTPKQLVWAVLLSFVVPILAIVLLVKYVTSHTQPTAGNEEAMTAQAVAQRLQRVGELKVKDPNDVSSMESGAQVYQAQCASCHAAGAGGAPKLGDAAAWAPRVKLGYEALLASALKGKGNMAAQGGGDYSNFEIGRAVVYMANQGGAKFDEPKMAVATAAAAPVAAVTPAPAAAEAPVAAAPAPVATAAAVPAVYSQVCMACHAAGVAGAPKLGDKAAWAGRLALGVDGLTASVIKGKGAMPAKGGAAGASDADIKAAVAYMVGTVK